MDPPSQVKHTAIDVETVLNENNIDNLQFFETNNEATGFAISGLMDSKADPSSARRHIIFGKSTVNFLDNKGFGWLLEMDENVGEEKPLLEELDIDLKDIYYKVLCVLLPLPYFRLKLSIVRESPDFWGPLMVVMSYSLLSLYGQLSVLSWIIIMWISGSFFVFFLARALGGDVSYSQVLGVIGYCLIPLVLVGTIYPLVSKFHFLSVFFGGFGVLWSVYSAGTLLCVAELHEKRSLLLYPVCLLYIYFFSLYSGV